MRLRVALIGLAIVAILASLLPSLGNLSGSPEYDLEVAARVEWHNLLEEWEVDKPGLKEASESPLISWKAVFANTFFFSGSEPKDMEFVIVRERGDAPIQTIQARTFDATGVVSAAVGEEGFVNVVFRKVPPGSYYIGVSIIDEDGRILDAADQRITVGAS